MDHHPDDRLVGAMNAHLQPNSHHWSAINLVPFDTEAQSIPNRGLSQAFVHGLPLGGTIGVATRGRGQRNFEKHERRRDGCPSGPAMSMGVLSAKERSRMQLARQSIMIDLTRSASGGFGFNLRGFLLLRSATKNRSAALQCARVSVRVIVLQRSAIVYADRTTPSHRLRAAQTTTPAPNPCPLHARSR